VRRRNDAGAASVEFALVVPLFFVLIGIAAFFAWWLYTESQLERAAQRAARYAAVPTVDGTYAYRHCDLVANVNSHLWTFSVGSPEVAVSDADAPLAAGCPDAAGRPRGWVQVRVTRTLDNPFSDLLGLLMRRSGPMTMVGSGEAKVEDTT